MTTIGSFMMPWMIAKVKLEVKLAAGYDPRKITIEEAQHLNPRWIVLERSKTDFKQQESLCADAASFDLPSWILAACIFEPKNCVDLSIARRDNSNDKLCNPDNFAILRGVSYHFESEIETALQHIYETYDHHDVKANDDLYAVALLFRLLRQQGYPISCDAFNKFKDDNGKIRESLIGDARGMLSLWWKELDFAKKMPFARDRVVECYFWILEVYFEPQYLLARRMLTKVIALTSIINDIYEVYGTLEELVLFTDAIERWEISAIDQLPEYMKLCYQALLDVYNMIDEEMARNGRSYRIHYAKSAMKILVRAYFEEAKWFHQGYVPIQVSKSICELL
ncbi:(-)-germacrene D synthase [Camellia lanceoleosa]|nr:(-)-germacrene D synthase [Camellia lanceoleosa]